MKKLFGTDGVRGVANVYPMTTEMAMQLGRAAAYIFKGGRKRRHRIDRRAESAWASHIHIKIPFKRNHPEGFYRLLNFPEPTFGTFELMLILQG